MEARLVDLLAAVLTVPPKPIQTALRTRLLKYHTYSVGESDWVVRRVCGKEEELAFIDIDVLEFAILHRLEQHAAFVLVEELRRLIDVVLLDSQETRIRTLLYTRWLAHARIHHPNCSGAALRKRFPTKIVNVMRKQFRRAKHKVIARYGLSNSQHLVDVPPTEPDNPEAQQPTHVLRLPLSDECAFITLLNRRCDGASLLFDALLAMMTQQPEDIRSRFTDEESLAEAMHVDGQLLRLGVGDAHRPHSTRTAVLHTDLFDVACLYTPHWQGLVFEVDLGGSSKLLGIDLGVGNVLCENLFFASLVADAWTHAPGWHLLVCSSGFAMSMAYFHGAMSIE
ncbi:hypothetical protein KC320_g213 [Hortaea werneckii]|nr:hypothetical protein KC320_g213 [Hortaea werneckii]